MISLGVHVGRGMAGASDWQAMAWAAASRWHGHGHYHRSSETGSVIFDFVPTFSIFHPIFAVRCLKTFRVICVRHTISCKVLGKSNHAYVRAVHSLISTPMLLEESVARLQKNKVSRVFFGVNRVFFPTKTLFWRKSRKLLFWCASRMGGKKNFY